MRTRTARCRRTARLEVLPGWEWTEEDATVAGLVAAVRAQLASRLGTPPRKGMYHSASWDASRLRKMREEGKLPERWASQLESMRGWYWDEEEAHWKAEMAAVKEKVAKTGRLPAPSGSLGEWLGQQHRVQREGALAPARAAELEALPDWISDFEHSPTWLHALEDWVARNGRAPPPDGTGVLSRVASALRERRAAGTPLPAGLAERMSALPGWFWDAEEAAWQASYQRLKAHLANHGGMPRSGRLVNWAFEQQVACGTGVLAPERAALLEGLPQWSWL